MLKGHVFINQTFGNHIFALFMNTFLAGHNGVINGYKNSMNLTTSGSQVTISSGALCVQGRFLEEDTSTTLDAGTNTSYHKLVLTINLDRENTEQFFNQGYYEILTSATGYPNLTQNNIVNTNEGKYQYELARFKTGLTGITDFVDKRTYLDFNSIYEELATLSILLHKSGGTMTGPLTLNQGLIVNSNGTDNGIELFGNTPYLDFHFNNNANDCTSRIIETEQGKLAINAPNGTNLMEGMDIWANTPHIDFHYNNDTGDFTSRIIESAKGKLMFHTPQGVDFRCTEGLFKINGTSITYSLVHSAAETQNYILLSWLSNKLALSVDNQMQGYFTLSSTSDRRLKTNIKEIDENVKKAIGEVKLKQFRVIRNNPQNKISFGVIAQELISAFEKYGLNYEDYDLIDTIEYEKGIKYFIVNYEQFNILRLAYLESKVV